MPARRHLPRPPIRRMVANIPAAHRPRQRRLSDRVRAAFHAACDEGAFEIALRLLAQLDAVIHHSAVLSAGIDRRQPESLAGDRERIINLMLREGITRPPD